jgi:hypothetical protein
VEITEIEVLRGDADGLIRDAADAALELRNTRCHLEELIKSFGSSDPAVRAAAFFALESCGDEWTMYRLAEQYPAGTDVGRLVQGLEPAVQQRRRKEHQKRGREEDRRWETLDTVRFD